MLWGLAWRLLALVFVLLGMVGVLLPGMPTTVFMLLAVWAASRGWPSLHRWMMEHPQFGPPIQNWQTHGAIPRHAKWLAVISMVFSMGLICLVSTALWIKWALPPFLGGVALWLWTRPELPKER